MWVFTSSLCLESKRYEPIAHNNGTNHQYFPRDLERQTLAIQEPDHTSPTSEVNSSQVTTPLSKTPRLQGHTESSALPLEKSTRRRNSNASSHSLFTTQVVVCSPAATHSPPRHGHATESSVRQKKTDLAEHFHSRSISRARGVKRCATLSPHNGRTQR